MMAKLSSIFFLSILCSIGLTLIKCEDMRSWTMTFNKSFCKGCINVILTCGESNKDQEVVDRVLRMRNYRLYSTTHFPNCTLSEIHSSIIAMSPNVQTLVIPDVELGKFQMDFWNAKNLENLMASNNRLGEIPPKLFINATQLANVDFSKNAIKRIDPLAFENVTSLQTLNLSNNQLDRIEPICLDHPKLLELDLSNNNLSSLEEGLFDKMAALTHLDLASNPIGNLHVGTLSQLANLEYLSLRRTNISSIELGTFSYQHKLVSLDLSDNQLTEFDFDLFLPIVHDLRSLYLSQNRLQHLNGFRNAIFPSLTLLDIKNNPFNCLYLKYFFDLVNWEKLRLIVDLSSTQSRKSNIRGINCEASSEASTNKYSTVQKAEMQNSLNDNLVHLIVKSNDDLFVVKVILFLVLTVTVISGAIYLLMNRNRVFNSNRYHRGVDEQNASPDPTVKYSNDGVLQME